jgi:PQQ-dependent catabolism-associated CXXCW motif protein
MIAGIVGGVAFAILALATGVAHGEEPAATEPEHYRNEDYRAPTPTTLRGARVIATAQAEALWRAGAAAFIDVMPQVPRPANLPEGTLWREKPRLNIPGSTWLVDTGYGQLSAGMEAYFRDGLERITAGDRAKLLVFYCLRDCWMSWNAAKRAVALGYAVAWYPDGTDGWQEDGLPLSAAVPASRPQD